MLRKQIVDALREDQNITEADLNALAKTRAESILSYMGSKGIETERLILLESLKTETKEEESEYIPTKLELGAR